MSACRYCRRPMRWVVTRNGKKMPLDPEAVDDGNVVMRPMPGTLGSGDPVAHVLADGEAPREGELRFRHHKTSCPKFARKR